MCVSLAALGSDWQLSWDALTFVQCLRIFHGVAFIDAFVMCGFAVWQKPHMGAALVCVLLGAADIVCGLACVKGLSPFRAPAMWPCTFPVAACIFCGMFAFMAFVSEAWETEGHGTEHVHVPVSAANKDSWYREIEEVV